MKQEIAEDIIKEGIDAVYAKLGAIKAIKFFQLLHQSETDSLKEVEEKTSKMSKNEVLELITRVRKQNGKLWKKLGLL